MKRLINIVLTIALLTATACEDFIEIEDRGEQNLDNYFATDAEAEAFVNGIYKSFAIWDEWWQQISRITNIMATDDAWMGNLGQDPVDHFAMSHYFVEASNAPGALKNYYRFKYENIGSANIAISLLPSANISEKLKARLIAEAKFFRAFSYWELVQNFGDVVLITQPRSEERRVGKA